MQSTRTFHLLTDAICQRLSAEADLELQQESLAALQRRLASLQESERQLQEQVTEARHQHDVLLNDSAELKQQLADTLSDNAALRDRAASAVHASVEHGRDAGQHKAALDRLQAALDAASRERDAYAADLRDLSALLQTHKADLAAAQRRCAELEQRTAAQADAERERERVLSDVEEEARRRTHELQTARAETAELREAHEHALARLEALQATTGAAAETHDAHAALLVRSKALERKVEALEAAREETRRELAHAEARYSKAVRQRETLSRAIAAFDAQLVRLQAQARAGVDEREHYRFLLEQAQHELAVRAQAQHHAADEADAYDQRLRRLHDEKADLHLRWQQVRLSQQHQCCHKCSRWRFQTLMRCQKIFHV